MCFTFFSSTVPHNRDCLTYRSCKWLTTDTAQEQLQEKLRALGADDQGTKAELVDRIREKLANSEVCSHHGVAACVPFRQMTPACMNAHPCRGEGLHGGADLSPEYLIPAVEVHRHRPVPYHPVKLVHIDLAYVLP